MFAEGGAIVADAEYGGVLGPVGIALTFGLVVMAMVYATGAAIAIGGVIALDALFGGPVTGASMNPARSFGPPLAAGEWRDFCVYLVGPLGGAALGALLYQLVRGEHPGVLADPGGINRPSPGAAAR